MGAKYLWAILSPPDYSQALSSIDFIHSMHKKRTDLSMYSSVQKADLIQPLTAIYQQDTRRSVTAGSA
jgi:hypothetical protein